MGFGRPGEDQRWIYRVDLKSGEFQQLRVELAGGGISKDDATFYQVNADPKTGNSRIVAVDIKGRLDVQAFTLRMPINMAWNISNDEMLAGAPKYLDSTRFDIIAKAPAGAPEIDL